MKRLAVDRAPHRLRRRCAPDVRRACDQLRTAFGGAARPTFVGLAIALVACHSTPPPAPPPPLPPDKPAEPPPPPEAKPQKLTADTPSTTVLGNTFVAPAEWSIVVKGRATILEAPEGDTHIAIVDLQAKDADAAIAAAWAAFEPAMKWPLQVSTPDADHDGWTQRKSYAYQVPPNEKRLVAALAWSRGDAWTAILVDAAQATAEKRGSQFNVMLGRLLPKGYNVESFAGKTAHELDAERLAKLTAFVDGSRDPLGIPGIALGIVQNGKVVFAGGFGVRELGKPAKVDADTLFIIASNTKALTTLLLAKLVDDKKLAWDTPVVDVMPTFKLGDAATTRSVLVRHLVCACTGMPRQDYEWLFEFAHATPETAFAALGGMQPTSKFGELFQYSNSLAAAGGYVAAHVIAPKRPLGDAYDAAMVERIFKPLGMTSTTFDFKRALATNHAGAFGLDIDGKAAPAVMAINYAVVAVRPAGGAWSNIKDMLKYVQMELARGALPGGKRFIGEEALLARRAPQVALSKDATYGMGLMVGTKYGTPVVHHGGDLVGYHSDMVWLPEHGVGAVILTNGDAGPIVREAFVRKLLEVLFDGEPHADAQLAAAATQLHDETVAARKLLTVPADEAAAGKLATHYTNPALGEIAVKRANNITSFDVGEWSSPVASRTNPDGTISFVMTAPGIGGFELTAGTQDGKRTLVARDAQHEYVFVER